MFSIRLDDLALQLNAPLYGDSNIVITGTASINSAKNGHITFLADRRFRKKLSSCQASAVALTLDNASYFAGSTLVVTDPYLAYARIAQLVNIIPNSSGCTGAGVTLAPDISLGKRMSIGANTVIESGVVIGNDVIIGPGCFVGSNTCIGIGTRLWANVTLYHNIYIG